MAEITGGGGLQKLLGQFRAKAKAAENVTVDVGFLPDAKYPDGTNVATVAAIQEFGAPSVGIPPRPFFRNMIAAHQSEWPEAIAANFKANDYDATKTLAQVGAAVAGQLRQSIIDTNSPPLSPITLMLRKMRSEGKEITGASVGEAARRVAAGETSDASAKPLVDTSVMLHSVDFRVNKE